jgi:hypothetical protein
MVTLIWRSILTVAVYSRMGFNLAFFSIYMYRFILHICG